MGAHVYRMDYIVDEEVPEVFESGDYDTFIYHEHFTHSYMSTTKYVQTDVDYELHAKLVTISKLKGMNLKDIVREAIKEYVKKFEEEVEKDSFFEIIGSFETKEGDWSERKDWRVLE